MVYSTNGHASRRRLVSDEAAEAVIRADFADLWCMTVHRQAFSLNSND